MLSTLKRTLREFREDNLADWAAALTYYGLLSLFPALIAVVSVIGLVGDPQSTTRSLTEIVGEIGPSSAADTFSGPIESLASNQSAAGFAFVLALALVLTGPIVGAVAGPLGIGSTAVELWDVAKWQAMAAIFVLMIDLLYYASPNAKLRGFRWVTPGALVALAAWALASAAFAFYVANFGSYDKTYGTLAGLVALLVWFWISNLAILFGHQLNAERERSLKIAEGDPRAEREIQLEPRAGPSRQP